MSSKERIEISNWISFWTAVQFLTRIPVSFAFSNSEFDHRVALKRSVAFFPLVGLLIGSFTGIVFSSVSLLWSSAISACIAIAAECWLTGAFHEDAFADATDALGGGWTRERVLEILKDSRHGTFGVLALVLGVGARVLLLAEIGPENGMVALPISAMLGRWAILWMMAWIPPIEDRQTMVRDVGSQTTWRVFCISGIVATVVWGIMIGLFQLANNLLRKGTNIQVNFVLMQPWIGYSIWIAVQIATLSLVVSSLFGRYVKLRVGGVTGDFLGANCYLVQLAVLLYFAARL